MSEGKLGFSRASWIIFKRDFLSIVMSKIFLAFLFGPLIVLMITSAASFILLNGASQLDEPRLIILMEKEDQAKVKRAYKTIKANTNLSVTVMKADVRTYNPEKLLIEREFNAGAVLYGTVENPRLMASASQAGKMRTVGNMLIAEARRDRASGTLYPDIKPEIIDSGGLGQQKDFFSSKLIQFVLYIMTSTMAVMILSNLSEEKSNRIVEVLATAIPMEALFIGKLLAMLSIACMALMTWGGFAMLAGSAAGLAGQVDLIRPEIGWPLFFGLFAIYFMTSYLFIGAIYLTIGGIAATAREAQTFSMPASMFQVCCFLLGAWGSSASGYAPWIIASIPVASPYLLLGLIAEGKGGWIHIYGIAMQVLFVILAVRYGAKTFRKRIIDTGHSFIAGPGVARLSETHTQPISERT